MRRQITYRRVERPIKAENYKTIEHCEPRNTRYNDYNPDRVLRTSYNYKNKPITYRNGNKDNICNDADEDMHLVCSGCLNRGLSEEKKSIREPKDPKTEYYGNSGIRERFFQSRIDKRAYYTNLAGKDIQSYENNEKEELQEINENENFWKNSQDHSKLRAGRRDKNMENLLKNNADKWPETENGRQRNYYEKYVGVGNEGFIKERPCPYDREQYLKDQQRIIDNNAKYKTIESENELRTDQRVLKGSMDRFDKKFNDDYRRHKQNLKDMSDTNKKMIDRHEQQRLKDRIQELREEGEILDQMERKNKKEDEELFRRKTEVK
ncbi:MAG: hypothetical protein MJ252_28380, partial [archaeon]|nr:hypothetical protein [archaeon]